MLNKVREEKGITLVVLIITIIVLLCLAGVIVYLVFGQDGLTGKDNALEAERDKAYAKDIVTYSTELPSAPSLKFEDLSLHFRQAYLFSLLQYSL